MKILFTGGGSGGHILPIIAISRELRKIYKGKDLQMFFIGPKDRNDTHLLSLEGIKVKNIEAGKLRRYVNFKSFFQNLSDILFKVPLGVIQSFSYLFFLSPDLIFSKGGFGSIPAVIAGQLLFIPVFLHESDISPGFANKILRGLALEIFTSFPETEHFSPKKLLLVGNPIRKELLKVNKKTAKKSLGIESNKPVIFIIGGSQGSQKINDEVLAALPKLLAKFEIIHQCGEKNYYSIKREINAIINKTLQASYHLYPFLHEADLVLAYAAADLVAGRAGSGTIFEIAASGKPAVLIPLPTAAQNHQLKNAYAYQKAGAAIVIEENNLSSNFFLQKLIDLFEDSKRMAIMAKKAKEFAKPEAGYVIAHYLIEYLTGR